MHHLGTVVPPRLQIDALFKLSCEHGILKELTLVQKKKESEALKDLPGVTKDQNDGVEKQLCFSWIPGSQCTQTQILHKIHAID